MCHVYAQFRQKKPGLSMVSVYRLVSELTGVSKQWWEFCPESLGSTARTFAIRVPSCDDPPTSPIRPAVSKRDPNGIWLRAVVCVLLFRYISPVLWFSSIRRVYVFMTSRILCRWYSHFLNLSRISALVAREMEFDEIDRGNIYLVSRSECFGQSVGLSVKMVET